MRCPLCGERARPPEFWKAGYPIARCPCGMIFVAEKVDPSVLHELYSEEYFAGGVDAAVPGYLGYEEEEPAMRRNFSRRLLLLERFVRPGPLLDVGCATGLFLAAAAERGWEPTGVELSTYAVREARDRGMAVLEGDFLQVDLPPANFAAITMLDVIEHTQEPRAYVRRSRLLLRAGGVLAIETADLASPFVRLCGHRYHFLTPPNHLSYFTRATLGRLLREEGFAEVRFFRLGKWVTLRRVIYRLYVSSRRPGLKKILAAAERSGAAGLTFPVNLGDGMFVVARAGPG